MNVLHRSYCPRCQSYLVYTTDKKILCPSCRLAFNKNMIGVEDDENILSDQELIDLLDSLKTIGDINKLKV
ncbi:MAG: hypothetical protein ACFE85_11385 [Candidatus Hodarchaeota archaeon]